MSRSEERRLLEETAKGNEKARRTLIMENIGFAHWKASMYPGRMIPFETLHLECVCALVEAVDTFDLSYSCKLITYAGVKMEVFMSRCFYKHKDEVPVPFRSSYRVRNTDTPRHGFWYEDGCRPPFEDFSEYPSPSAIEIASSCEAHTPPAKDRFGHRKIRLEPEGTELVRFLAEEECLEETAISSVERELVNELVENLPERLRYVIRRCFGLAGYDRGTLAEVAAELSLSRERVRQLKKQGLELLSESVKQHFSCSDQ